MSIAEWAIARLQAEGSQQAHHKTDRADNVPDTESQSIHAHPTAESEPYPTDLNSKVVAHGSYTCSSEKHGGRLVVTSEGVRFESFVGSRHQWKIKYDNMNRVEKVSDISLDPQ